MSINENFICVRYLKTHAFLIIIESISLVVNYCFTVFKLTLFEFFFFVVFSFIFLCIFFLINFKLISRCGPLEIYLSSLMCIMHTSKFS